MISDQYKCIYIHIPKTAGTSIEHLLGIKDKGSSHEPLSFYENEKKALSYFTFSFVRNPWARLYSVFNYYKKGGNKTHKKLYHPKYFFYSLKRGFKNIQRYSDMDICRKMPPEFEDFCLMYLRDKEDFFGRNALLPQVDFITTHKGHTVDFVGRFERLQQDIEHIKQKLFIHKNLPHKRRQKSTDYRIAYNTKTHDLVVEFYKRDIDTFGYTFDN